MAEGNPTEFLIENDKKFIYKFIKFMKDKKSQYHITDYEVNKLSSHLNEGANMYVGGYFGVTINMNLALYTAENPFSFDFMEVDNLIEDPRLFNNKVKKFMNSINGDKLDTTPSSPKKKGGKRKKKKTRKKRGGMEAPPTPPRPPRDNDVGTNRYMPGNVVQPFITTPQNPQANSVPIRRNMPFRRHENRAPLNMRISDTEIEGRVNAANQRYRRSQRSHLRNFTGDVLESCTGSRCGLGGSRRRKSRKKKKTRRRKKMRRKKNRKRRTKKKSRSRKKR